jgi:hypothetical protein
LELAGLAGVVPVYIGGVFLPHLDGFCHLSQDNPNKYLLALVLGDRLYKNKKHLACSKAIFEIFFWEGGILVEQLGFASGYRRIFTAIYMCPVLHAR